MASPPASGRPRGWQPTGPLGELQRRGATRSVLPPMAVHFQEHRRPSPLLPPLQQPPLPSPRHRRQLRMPPSHSPLPPILQPRGSSFARRRCRVMMAEGQQRVEGQAHLLQQHGHPCGGRVTRCAACSCTAAMILRTLGNRSCAGASHHTPAVRAGDLDETCACARHSVGWRGRPYSSYAHTLRCDRETNF